MACACWGVASLGYSRRARLYGASCSRFYLRQEVALRQPKVTAQLPAGGDVSLPCPCGAWRFSLFVSQQLR